MDQLGSWSDGMRSAISVLLWLGAFAGAQGNRTHLVETSDSFESRILSRRVRGLVFPDKASILLTAALTKIIVGGRPSGLQYSLEFDIYVPLPDTVEGWQPKILKRLKPKYKPMPKRRLDWSYYKRPLSFYSNYSSPYKNAYYARPSSKSEYFYQTKSSPAFNRDLFYQTPWHLSSPIKSKNYYEPREEIYKSSTALNRDSFYQHPWSLSSITNRRSSYQPDEEVYESWTQVPSWKLNRGYRERREIFDQFEAMGRVFQLDLRSCIKRAMCELRAKFSAGRDQGFLMEDLMRIVLTVPEEIGDDKYRHRMDVKDCARFYSPSCPYNVLDFLTQSGKKM
ncbi:uncharacterized protein LOC128253758 [Drosophila gunungcola]|uniref:Uncharacterized protein n=1 Tax=Drosophila gunungcola TaxID=103775 RepID=A0A9P9YYT1_9MUSC|nr:uncharacterized protein LOC128253758 [Drosophila gunungcola]KAI8045586.1 hypothetical protein M5D96_001768 [Drosophila gunungcola]